MLEIGLALSYCEMDFSVDECLVFSCLKNCYSALYSLHCVRIYFYCILPKDYLKIII